MIDVLVEWEMSLTRDDHLLNDILYKYHFTHKKITCYASTFIFF